MKRRSEKQGLALARKFEASGWSQAEFARRSRMRVATLRYWLRRIQTHPQSGIDELLPHRWQPP